MLRRQLSAALPSVVGPYSTMVVSGLSRYQRMAWPSWTGCSVSTIASAKASGRPSATARSQNPASMSVSERPASPPAVIRAEGQENCVSFMALDSKKRGKPATAPTGSARRRRNPASATERRLDRGDGTQAEGGDGERRIAGGRGGKHRRSQDEHVGVIVTGQGAIDHGGLGIPAHARRADDMAGPLGIGTMGDARGAEPVENIGRGAS